MDKPKLLSAEGYSGLEVKMSEKMQREDGIAASIFCNPYPVYISEISKELKQLPSKQ